MSSKAIDASKPYKGTMPRPVFTYGSLMSDKVISRVLKGFKAAKRIENVVLNGYKRVKVLNAPYPAVYETNVQSDEVRGILYLVEDMSIVNTLDVFESSQYERRTVQVHVPGEKKESIEADVYVWRLDKSLLSQLPWDYDDFLKNQLSQWLQDGSDFEETDGNLVATANGVVAASKA